ncbi:AraC family transcriptional regulator [Pyxidicoccus fallax]|uniref:AraC family transcriptional regulator n=1 Tax=Pyxidicoccus fallax TaxID=394095 RepID=A0A848LNC1_9BACT|nr:AraC family transcriptional regulator [Pyxidicoccus fallax]NMO19179.1 AraC family transcriptional regulator [Pyxidicoccus fallax]NPC81527.1 AraC family transcriptional regulator [Pyxidicoccus fallax]
MLARSSELEAIPSDPLSEVLQDLRLTDGSYGRCELSRPWGIEFAPLPSRTGTPLGFFPTGRSKPLAQARFHFVVSGDCWLRAPKRGWLELHPGDVVLVPQGNSHALADRARGRLKPLEQIPLDEVGEHTYHMRTGGMGATTTLVCGSVSFAQPAMHPLLALMPPVLLVRGEGRQDATFGMLLQAMAEEVLARRIGAATVMTRLADVVIARVIRAWVESHGEEARGWLAALRDPRIGRALAEIHQRPGEPWSVESLADVAMTSRSVFSARFTSIVGMSPARYLARWRMHVASGWLRDGSHTVAQVAAELGYDSEAAFSRAFKRYAGIPPSAVRRQGRDERA